MFHPFFGSIMRRITPKLVKQTSAQSSANLPVLLGPWMLKHGVGTLRITDGMRARSGNYVTTLGHRFAQYKTDLPGDWVVSTNTRSANGLGTRDVDVSATTDQLWVQAALFGKSTDGLAGTAQTSLQLSTDGNPRIIAAATFDVQAYINSGEAAWVAVGPQVGAFNISGLMFVAVVVGVGGTVMLQPAWRKWVDGYESPDAWSTLDSEQTITGNTNYNSGNEAISPGTSQLIQPGLKLGGAGGRGTVNIIVVAK